MRLVGITLPRLSVKELKPIGEWKNPVYEKVGDIVE